MGSRLCAVVTWELVPIRARPRDLCHASQALVEALSGSHLLGAGPAAFSDYNRQILVEWPAHALSIALFVRAHFRAFFNSRTPDTTVCIAIGPRPPTVPREDLRFRSVTHRLSDHLTGRHTGRIHFDCTAPYKRHWSGESRYADIEIVLVLLDRIVSRWRPNQARAVAGMLIHNRQAATALHWPGGAISQQAVSQHLRAAGWDSVRQALWWYTRQANRRFQDD